MSEEAVTGGARQPTYEELLARLAKAEQKVCERTEELRRASLTLKMISECNQALVRATDDRHLVEEICNIVVGIGTYRMAWVGFAENDEGRTVRPAASVGFEDGYLDRVRISWGDNELGRGPTGTCIRTRQVQVGVDFLSEPKLAPWRAEALKRGFRSSIALPLMSGANAFGALTLYAEAPNFFDEKQIALLRELADDLAIGIAGLRSQRERDHALRVAEHRAGQLRALAAQLTDVEQRERRQLARILHDHIQQLLIAATFNVGLLRGKVKAKDLRETVEQLSETLAEAIRASRSLTAELSPPVLHEKGLAAGLEWLAHRMRDRHGLEVEVVADAPPYPLAEHSRVFLYEAVRELLLNVVKHAGVKRAEVRLARQGGELQVTVSDAGAGFDPMRLEAAGSSGGGFGLFSIRERLEFLGGRMEVDSAPGRGSRFTLVTLLCPEAAGEKSLPAGAATGVSVPSAEALLASEERVRVLLADDHHVMRQGLMAVLRGQPDLEVVGEASDGVQAVELARELIPDVVIMDVSMPHMGGVEATRRITAELPQVGVIGLSLHEEANMAAAMREAGARVYLSKAGPAEDLIAAIRACRPGRTQGN